MHVPLLKTTITKEDLLQIDEGFRKMVEEVYSKISPEDKKFFYLLLFHTEVYKAFFSIVYAIRLITLAVNKKEEKMPLIIPDWLYTLFANTEVEYFFNFPNFVDYLEEHNKTYLVWKNKNGKAEKYTLDEIYEKLAPYGIDSTFIYRYVSPDLLAFFLAYAENLENRLAQGEILL